MKKAIALGILALLAALNSALGADLMAIWDFGPDADGYTEDVTTEHVIGIPTLSLSGGDIDTNGKDGIAYVDAAGTFHDAGQGAAWDDVRVTGPDAELIITIDTTGWRDLAIRWDYMSDSTPSFDLAYEIDESGNWISILNNEPIFDDWEYHSFSCDLSSIAEIENNAVVKFRMDDLDRDGNNEFVFDNLELTGVRMWDFMGHLMAWGDNSHGESDSPDGNDFTAISAGGSHNLAIRSNGSLVGWGDNSKGQRNVPGGSDFADISAGYSHSLALKSDGTLTAWGDNTWGQLNVPTGYNFAAIAAGNYHNVALHSNGWLTAWGKNEYGQCNVPAGTNFGAISAGRWHSLALKTNGSLAAWGWNYYGQTNVPAGDDYVAISAGEAHNLALKVDGSLVAWGDNSYGECDVPGGNDFVAIAAGYSHSVALKADGTLVAWGWNYHGQCDVPSGPALDFVAISAGGGHSLAVTSKLCTAPIAVDFNGDCKVDFADFAIFSRSWLECNLDPREACWE